jgi:hypothetical protein
MPFFSRPNLSDEQFKQLIGLDGVLTLSGQTRIASTSGLTLTNGSGGYIPIIVTGATLGDVLTYDINGQITLKPISGSTGSGIYSGASPTTCTVGGLIAGSSIAGQSISMILEEILVPTLNPVMVEPYSSFVVYPSNSVYEVGTSISVTGCTTFNRGSITPVYCGGPAIRSAGACCYLYNVWGTPTGVTSSILTNVFPFGAYNINAGSNTLSSCVCYSGGSQPLNSSGGNYLTPLAASATTSSTCVISGVYPYYWGRVTCAAAAGVGRPSSSCIQTIITGGTGTCCKVAACSTGTLTICFNSGASDYIWFVIPSASTPKTKWCVDALNNGNIGGAVSAGGNLFPTQENVTNVCSNLGCWNGQTYQIYVSNYQTASSTYMYLKNI